MTEQTREAVLDYRTVIAVLVDEPDLNRRDDAIEALLRLLGWEEGP